MEESATAQPVKKRSLPFKATALRKQPKSNAFAVSSQTDVKSEDDGLGLFKRSKEMVRTLEADRERRLKRKQSKIEKERRQSLENSLSARRSDHSHERSIATDHLPPDDPVEVSCASPAVNRSMTVPGDDSPEPVTPPPSKRSRPSPSSSKSHLVTILPVDPESSSKSPSRRLRSHLKQSPLKATVESAALTPASPIICLDSDSDEDVKPLITPSKRLMREPSPILLQLGDEDEDEDEYAEWERKVKMNQAALKPSTTVVAEILVSSEVPQSVPLMCKYLFTKPLRIVRDTWAASQRKHGISVPKDNDDIILTWCRQKVYVTNNLISLGINPGEDGRVGSLGRSRSGFNRERNKIHMEAWTLESYEAMKHKEEVQRRRAAGNLSDDEDDDEAANAATPPPQIKLRIILKARDLEDVRLTVRPETTMETLVTGYRTQREVAPEKDIGLWFDGERLEEHLTMRDADIDDMDTIEVLIK